VEWKITLEGTDAFGEVRRHEILIDKSWDRLFDGEIGLSVEDGKEIMAALQTAIVSQEADTYALFPRVCPDCGALRPVKDYTTGRIRTVYGTVECAIPAGRCVGIAIRASTSPLRRSAKSARTGRPQN
jgi:hypothetical protein